jgi:hypothetical protein
VCCFKEWHSSWDIDRVKNKLRNSFIPRKGMQIYINEVPLNPIEIKEDLSTEEFSIFIHSSAESRIFNQGLSVCDVPRTMHKYCINVIPKAKLNFARNEFMDGDELTVKLWEFIKKVEQKLIVEKPDLEFSDAQRVLSMISRGWLKLDDYLMNKPFIPSARDSLKYSFSQLAGEEVLVSETNTWADDVINQGYSVVHEDVAYDFEDIIYQYELDIEISDEEVEDLTRRGYHETSSKHELGGKEVYYYVMQEMNNDVFKPSLEYVRDIQLGKSDVADGWTDGYDIIWINKSVILYSKDKMHILMRMYHIMAHEYAHNDETIKKDYHNSTFYQEYHFIIKKTHKRFATFVNNCNLKLLKRKYDL